MAVVPITLPNGKVIYAEVSRVRGAAEPRAARPEADVADRHLLRPDYPANTSTPNVEGPERDVVNWMPTGHDMNAVMAAIDGIAQTVSTSAERSKAFEVNVEFGLEISVDNNGTISALIVKGSAKGSLKIGLKWSRQDKASASMTGTLAPAHPGASEAKTD